MALEVNSLYIRLYDRAAMAGYMVTRRRSEVYGDASTNVHIVRFPMRDLH